MTTTAHPSWLVDSDYDIDAFRELVTQKTDHADVPRAMAEAFRKGTLGVMDYYRMQNIQADSTMRESIADQGDSSSSKPPIR